MLRSVYTLILAGILIGSWSVCGAAFQATGKPKPPAKAGAQPAVNAGAAAIQDFQKRVDEYVALHKKQEDTLPKLDSPVVLAFLDVDLEDSLATCVRNLWPHIVDGGYFENYGALSAKERKDDRQRCIGTI